MWFTIRSGDLVITMSTEEKKEGWLTRLFEPEKDFYSLLTEQASITLEGMEALEHWIANGCGERCQTVRDLEHKADKLKLNLEKYLVGTLITPLDREDIYDLSARLDEVINAAKRCAREIEALEFKPDGTELLKMSGLLKDGSACLLSSFTNLASDLTEASSQATLARKVDSKIEKMYRAAMKDLYALDDVKMIIKTVEVYRAMVHAANRIDVVGEKLLHVIVKMS